MIMCIHAICNPTTASLIGFGLGLLILLNPNPWNIDSKANMDFLGINKPIDQWIAETNISEDVVFKLKASIYNLFSLTLTTASCLLFVIIFIGAKKRKLVLSAQFIVIVGLVASRYLVPSDLFEGSVHSRTIYILIVVNLIGFLEIFNTKPRRNKGGY